MTKTEFIQSIRQSICDGQTEEALHLMREKASDFDSSILSDVIILESRYQNVHSDFVIKGILPREDYDRTVLQINFAILELIERLEKSTFLTSNSAKDKSNGRILHNIPGIMPLGKESRCTVRIAYDDATLLRDFKATEDTVIQNVRIAEVMGVELIDFNETPAFTIRTITEEEQFLTSDDFTQWIFQVKPILEGKFPLTLKVSVIEQIDGKERKRDIVLEKEIFIINQPTEATSPPPSVAGNKIGFEETNIRLNYIVTDEAAAIPQVATKKRSSTAIVSALATVIFAITGLLLYRTSNLENKSAEVAHQKEDTTSYKNNTTLENSTKSELAEAQTQTSDTSSLIIPEANIQIHAVPKAPPPPPVKKKIVPNEDIASTKKPTKKIYTKPLKKEPKGIHNDDNSAGDSSSYDVVESQQNPSSENSDSLSKANDSNILSEVKTYKVKLKLKDEMKDANILVNGQKPIAIKRNIWGTPQYIEFKSNRKLQEFSFSKDGITCKIQNVEIKDDNLELEACSFKKKKGSK